MTVVCLHAEAARRPQADGLVVDASLEIIETTTREAMHELRKGLRVLETAADLVEEMFGFAHSLGVQVDVHLAGLERPLGAEDALLARRVVREALVNAVRHAPGTAVQVQILADPAGSWSRSATHAQMARARPRPRIRQGPARSRGAGA
jgi:signal transduction histidine kinase